MAILQFQIIDRCFQQPKGRYDDVDFLLEKDGWNDFHYHVMYHLHATNKLTHKGNEYLGPIRIMRKGQAMHEIYTLEKSVGVKKIFSELPTDYVSLSCSVDLYTSLSRLLSPEARLQFVKSMHLILSENSPYYKIVEDDDCFLSAMLRDSSMDDFALQKGRELLEGGAIYYNLREQIVGLTLNDVSAPIELNFSCLSGENSDLIPNGIIAFIGKNGTGKSTAIYDFAKLIYASPDQRFRLKEDIGSIEPKNLGISKLFLISYSPFDNFVYPGIGGDDYQLIYKSLNSCDGRFIYCGIRDIEQELHDALENQTADTYNELYKKRRVQETSLKSNRKLADECAQAMSVIEADSARLELWHSISTTAKAEYGDIYCKVKEILDLVTDEDKANYFMQLSTGYKFYLHSLAHIIAYIDNDSMILFDEPENHIHPPMLSFMMYSLRKVLTQYQSVMLVATHSPVVVQETFSKNVFVVRNNEGAKTISHPHIETYGASMAELTNEVFDLTVDVTKYYSAFEYLFKIWKSQERWTSIENMLSSFRSHLGGDISSQMISFLINLYVSQTR